ncbi:MAG: hypothetical protein H0U85_07215 [Gemmatimonadales bacterium]|nr:hypothetical protein [Gemmatimonadales bacterium]
MMREFVVHYVLYPGGIAFAVTILVMVDRSPSDVANQACLLVLLLTAGGLGFARPRTAWLAGVVVGSSLAVAHATYQVAGVQLPYPMSPAGWAGALALLLLLAPAFGAAYTGAAVGRRFGRPS